VGIKSKIGSYFSPTIKKASFLLKRGGIVRIE